MSVDEKTEDAWSLALPASCTPRRAGTLRELPEEERPRERLLSCGAGHLSDAELIAILLRSGYRGATAIEVARGVLAAAGGLAGLLTLESKSLRAKGLGPAKIATLLAAVELATRVARAEVPERHALHRPAAAARYLLLRYARRDQEVMGALYLDSRQRLMHDAELFRGTINRAAVEPRVVLKEGLLIGAAAFLLFHTHPSGDPAPSAEDLAFTRRLAEAAQVVGLDMVDHLILGTTRRWISLRERGAW
jgi:DNA repair protein RadC